MKNKPLKHLNAAMKLSSAQGLCFHRSVALCLDWPRTHVVIGLMPAARPEEIADDPRLSPTPFYHAWCEVDEYVFAPTTIERMGSLGAFIRDDYYHANEIIDYRGIKRPRILELAQEHGWRKHLLTGSPIKTGKPFADPLLDEVGYDWGMSADYGVVPIEYATTQKETHV